MSHEDEWNARYATAIWSGKPNDALVAEVSDLKPGRALDLGCGEGGDAIWLAGQGWTVTAADLSQVALDRAAAHAADKGVTVDWQRHDLAATFPDGEYDLVCASFLHFEQETILRKAAAAVAPGGVLLIENHLDFGPFPPEGHADATFPSADELIAMAGAGDWDVLTSAPHPRTQIGPDGEPASRTDVTVKLRRG